MNTLKLNLFSLAALVLFLNGCNSLKLNVPSNRMISPESIPTLKGKLATGAATQSTIVLEDDASSRPYSFSPPTLERSTESFFLKGNLGLGRGFEFFAKIGTLSGSSSLHLKYQILGPLVSEAKHGDSSLAVVIGNIFSSDKKAGDQNGTFGPGGYNWDASVISSGNDIALVYGYRKSDTVLLYGGPFYTKWDYRMTIHHQRSDDGSSPEAKYEVFGTGERKGISLAAEFAFGANRYVTVTPELVLSSLSWTNLETRNQADGGLTIGWSF